METSRKRRTTAKLLTSNTLGLTRERILLHPKLLNYNSLRDGKNCWLLPRIFSWVEPSELDVINWGQMRFGKQSSNFKGLMHHARNMHQFMIGNCYNKHKVSF